MKNTLVSLNAKDNHRPDAYYCSVENADAGIIILHEIFGLTPYIQDMCEYWANKGYQTIAPALYDRYEKNVNIPYHEHGIKKALEYKQRVLNWDKQLLDIDAAKNFLLAQGIKKVSVIGFSWGGTLAWLAACRLKDIVCTSSYYGPHIYQFNNETPKCPVQMHFAQHDELVPETQIKEIQEQHPNLELYIYPAGHGFRCNPWYEYDADASKLSDKRTHNFLHEILSQPQFGVFNL